MNTRLETGATEFNIEGQFLAFVVDDGKVKHLRISVDDRELQIKLSKEARASLFQAFERSPIRPLDRIRVCGEKKCDRHTGECKLKAYCIEKSDRILEPQLVTGSQESAANFSNVSQERLTPKGKQAKLKLLVCYKSGCQKRGGKQQHRVLARILGDRNLDYITIEETGCLGKCSMAPNIMMMPGKKRLSGMKPEAIVDLLESLR